MIEYQHLGNTGMTVSKICLGTGGFGSRINGKISHKILDTAFEYGINFWDTANIYGREDPLLKWKETSGRSEKVLGEWFDQSNSRDEIVLSSKARWPYKFSINKEGLSRKHLKKALQDSLERLKTDYFDIYFAHGDDQHTPVIDVVRTYNDMISEGKIIHYGLSNFQNYRIMKYILTARHVGLLEPTVLQFPYSLTNRKNFEYELPNLLSEENLGTMGYSPLDTGFLASEFNQSNIEEAEVAKRAVAKKLKEYENKPIMWKIRRELGEIANEIDATSVQVALQWNLHQKFIDTVVLGVSTPEQLIEAIQGFEVNLDKDHIRRLDQISLNHHQPWWVSMYNDNYLDWISQKIAGPITEGKYSHKDILFE